MDIKRVGGTGGVKGAGGVKPKGAPKGAFAALLDEMSAAPSGAVGAISSVGALEALLAVQETGDSLESEGKSKQRAEQLLDQLDDLQLAVLDGTISPQQLQNLSNMAQSQRGAVQNPQLKSVLDEIDLRAQVELAKYTPRNIIA